MLIEVGSISSPLTRSAIVIFEDSLQDDQKLAEVVAHTRRLREDLRGAVPLRIERFLDDLILRLGAVPGDHHAAMFRSGFLQHRGIASV